MRVAIIGAGPAGLYISYKLSKLGHKVTLYEKSDQIGGLAGTFKFDGFELEKYYHHVFQGDLRVIRVIGEIGGVGEIEWRSQNTANFVGGKLYPFSSAPDILRYPRLFFFARFRLGFVSFLFKIIPEGLGVFLFSKKAALEGCRSWFGESVTKEIWQPLLAAKFGEFTETISMVWLWGRIKKRSFKLGYLRGGFGRLWELMVGEILKSGGEVRVGQEVLEVNQRSKIKDQKYILKIKNGREEGEFDRVIFTTSRPTPDLLESGRHRMPPLQEIRYLGSRVVIFVIKNRLTDYYWINVNDPEAPFLALVEHTNFRPASEYGGRHIVYLGNYLDPKGEEFKLSDDKVVEKAVSFLKTVNPDFEQSWVEKTFVFKDPLAQPIVGVGYEKEMPEVKLDDGLYWVSMGHIWPWDRGLEQAFGMGDRLLKLL